MSSGIFSKQIGYLNRQSIRLPGYDYSQRGYYFVTVCIHDRKQNFFGDVVDGKMVLNEYGKIAENEFLRTEKIRPNIRIDEYAIMPNHAHVIIHICYQLLNKMNSSSCRSRGTLQRAPTAEAGEEASRIETGRQIEQFGKPTSNSIPTIVRLTKSTITKQINILRNTPGSHVWQRNYYEHIVRDETSLFFIRRYIRNNPMQWKFDTNSHIDREILECDLVEKED